MRALQDDGPQPVYYDAPVQDGDGQDDGGDVFGGDDTDDGGVGHADDAGDDVCGGGDVDSDSDTPGSGGDGSGSSGGSSDSGRAGDEGDGHAEGGDEGHGHAESPVDDMQLGDCYVPQLSPQRQLYVGSGSGGGGCADDGPLFGDRTFSPSDMFDTSFLETDTPVQTWTEGLFPGSDVRQYEQFDFSSAQSGPTQSTMASSSGHQPTSSFLTYPHRPHAPTTLAFPPVGIQVPPLQFSFPPGGFQQLAGTHVQSTVHTQFSATYQQFIPAYDQHFIPSQRHRQQPPVVVVWPTPLHAGPQTPVPPTSFMTHPEPPPSHMGHDRGRGHRVRFFRGPCHIRGCASGSPHYHYE